jgi:hypothetical protein
VVSAQIRAEGGPRPASLSLLGPRGPPGKPDGHPRGSSANVKHKRLIRHPACELCANYRTLPLLGLKIAARSIDHEGEKEEEAWLRVRREAVAAASVMPQPASVSRSNCVNLWTPGRLNRATNRLGPKPFFGSSSWGLEPRGTEAHLRTGPRKASEMAAREIDRLIDPSAAQQEDQRRKRRLIKGPARPALAKSWRRE